VWGGGAVLGGCLVMSGGGFGVWLTHNCLVRGVVGVGERGTPAVVADKQWAGLCCQVAEARCCCGVQLVCGLCVGCRGGCFEQRTVLDGW
jgi:hypothetical protein